MNLLCWEGYESNSILGEFSRERNIKSSVQTLLSDAETAHAILAGELKYYDVLNINNPWCRDLLCRHGVIKTLDEDRFAYAQENLLPEFDRLSHWTRNDSGELIGLCQRFGAFNLVVNTDRIDRISAEDQGFHLAGSKGQCFGILAYDDFNIMHICIGAGLNPFKSLDHSAMQKFSDTASDWHMRSQLISDDHNVLNRALLDGQIDFYISGGVYTVSTARMDGHTKLRAITPASRGADVPDGIVFAEITSVLQHSQAPADALAFLEFIVRPEIAFRVATTKNTLNPVAQMGNPDVFSRFTTPQLEAIQWETLTDDVSRCAMYRIPPDHAELLVRLRKARGDR